MFLVACDSDDDGFYNSVYIQSTGLVTIENPAPAYSTGEAVLFEAHIPRLLNEPGQAEPVDVMATTNADSFQFTFYVEKFTNGQWEVVDISDDYIAGTEGTANVGFYVQGFVVYDNVADSYLYNGGIAFDQAGDYRFNFSNNTQYYNKVFLQSNSENNNIVMNIFSASPSIDTDGIFEFTVN